MGKIFRTFRLRNRSNCFKVRVQHPRAISTAETMKENILKTLEFPRVMIRENVDLRSCRFNGHYVGELGCELCNAATECKWLTQHDEFSNLANKPLAEIAEALEFAMHFVEALVMDSDHESEVCRCEACRWLRGARETVADLHHHSTGSPE